jgi:glycerol-3-phosphate O-acyltransferase/dihydroxyacetone phosphate acyltransferase
MTTNDPTLADAFLGLLMIISYDCLIWFCNSIIITYFRDIKTRGSFNIPSSGPIIFVFGPHHNQFIDGAVVIPKVKEVCGRRPAFLIANKSYKLKFIGTLAKMIGAIPVERAQDVMRSCTGTITSDDGVHIVGEGTKFTEELMVKGLVGLPESLGSSQIESIEDDTHATLKKPLKSSVEKFQQRIAEKFKNGTPFKLAPHIDNHVIFENVFDHLAQGKAIGIFPEGGSHDRPDLLPLKPGVAIMALGAIANLMNQGRTDIEPVNIIPVGLNYFHPHKFRSRVVLEFGKPIVVDKKWGESYQKDSRSTTTKLLDLVTLALKDVTVGCDDYDTLMALQAARRLFTSGNRENIPLPLVVEMNRRLIKGYQKYSDDPEIVAMKEEVIVYNKRLTALGLHDHQVEGITETDRVKTFFVFLERLFKFSVFMALSLPGVIMFSPVFITAKKISRKKAQEALASSTVKIKAQDVLGTWKVLVALGLAPILYVFYSILGTYFIVKKGYLSALPVVVIFLICYSIALLITYSALKAGEIGVDYYKSLRPLALSVFSPARNRIQIQRLKEKRKQLAARVDNFCHKYGPYMFEDYDKFYREYNQDDDYEIPSYELPRKESNETLSDYGMDQLGSIPIFSNEAPVDIEGEEEHDRVIVDKESDEKDGNLSDTGLRFRASIRNKLQKE